MHLVSAKEYAGLMARQTCSISARFLTHLKSRRDFYVPRHYPVNISSNWGVPWIKLRRLDNHSLQTCDHDSCSGTKIEGPHVAFTKFDQFESAGRKLQRNVVPRTSRTSEPFDLDGESTLPTEFVETGVNWSSAFWRFTRPHTIIGSGLGVTSVSLMACQGVSDVNFKFAIGLLKAVIPALCMNVYIVGLNQLYDIDIDKVNKPDLPLASGEFSIATGILLVTFFAAMSLGMGFYVESPPLLWALMVSLVLGTAYSANLPFLRWKRSAVAAAACILAVRAVVVQLGFYLHMQVSVLGRAAKISKPLWFATGFMCFFSVVIALAKDIPDVRGDKEFGIRSFSVRLGQKRVFWMCVTLLEAAYLVAIITGLTAPTLASKVITATGHAIMAGLLWERSDSIDLSSKAAITSWYMFIWKLFYAEYLLIPFMR